MFAVIFICGNLFLRIAGKTAKIAKIRTRNKFVPHGKGTRFIRRFQKSREVSVNSVNEDRVRAYGDADGRCENADGKKNKVKSSKPEACQTCGISIKITVIITII